MYIFIYKRKVQYSWRYAKSIIVKATFLNPDFPICNNLWSSLIRISQWIHEQIHMPNSHNTTTPFDSATTEFGKVKTTQLHTIYLVRVAWKAIYNKPVWSKISMVQNNFIEKTGLIWLYQPKSLAIRKEETWNKIQTPNSKTSIDYNLPIMIK